MTTKKLLLALSIPFAAIGVIFFLLSGSNYSLHVEEVEDQQSDPFMVGGRVYSGEYLQDAINFAIVGGIMALIGVMLPFAYPKLANTKVGQGNN